MTVPLLGERQKAARAAFGMVEGVEVARHYGEPGLEYRAVRESAGLVVRSDRAQLRMWGRDPIRMLNGLITNDLGLLGEQRAVYGAMLTPKGRVITDLLAISRSQEGATELLVDIPAAAVEAVSEHLKKYVPPLFARWELIDEQATCLGLYGPAAIALLSETLGVPAAPEQDRITRVRYQNTEVMAVATRYAGGESGFDVFAGRAAAVALWDELLERGASHGIRPVGHATLETLRIEAGNPRFGAEITDAVLPAEALDSTGQMERAISFSKGCYTGQEVVVRIAHRGHVNRHVRGLLLGDSAAPAAKTPLVAAEGEKEVGWITSSAQSPLMGQTIALGYVRREVSPGDQVRVGEGGSGMATVVAVPFSG